MSSKTKSLFISAYPGVLPIAALHSTYQLFNTGFTSAWLGAAVAVWPMTFFFLRLFVSDVARTSANLNGYMALSVIGSVLVLALPAPDKTWPLIYAVGLGLGGILIYVFWYSRFGREHPDALQVGQPLPSFELEDTEGNTVSSLTYANAPTLFMFYRGNWCPLCMAQIKEVAAAYQELGKRGVKVVLVSPQSHKNTQSLARKFQVPFDFLVDAGNRAAKALGIEAQSGTPKAMEPLGYEADTVMPTVLMTNAEGVLIFADLTDNYRVRPEPQTFIRILDEQGVTA